MNTPYIIFSLPLFISFPSALPLALTLTIDFICFSLLTPYCLLLIPLFTAHRSLIPIDPIFQEGFLDFIFYQVPSRNIDDREGR